MDAYTSRMTSDTRLFTLDGPPPFDQMHVERWSGYEQLSDLYCWDILVLSDNPKLSFDAMLGKKVRLLTTLPDGTRSARSGLVAQVRSQNNNGALTRYHLELVPWLWVLAQGRNSRAFTSMTVAQIVHEVFCGYPEYADWEIDHHALELLNKVRPRSFCVQYRESDFDFIQRLLAEEGLGYRFVEHDKAPAGHKMHIFGYSLSLPEDATSASDKGLTFQATEGTRKTDAIQHMGPCAHSRSTRVTILSSTWAGGGSTVTSLPTGSKDVGRESYDQVGCSAFLNGPEARHYAALHVEALEVDKRYWKGRATVRSARCGMRFSLPDAPWAASGPYKDQREFLLIRMGCHGINNLPDSLPIPADRWTDVLSLENFEPEVLEQAQATGFAQQFNATLRKHPFRPTLSDGTGQRLNPKPTALGAQTAIVVNENGDTHSGEAPPLFCDALGRVCVRFHWQEEGDRATTWLRVAQMLAGDGHGAQFLPRVGHEVLVQFMHGDMDRPVIIKSLYNGRGDGGEPPTPADKYVESDRSMYAHARDHQPTAEGNHANSSFAPGNSPAWHGGGEGEDRHRHKAALSGIKTQGFDGKGYNQLVFDDSDGQGRLQMATTQAHSQLNLGHLIHQAGNYRGSFRGLGFELRTDAYGAIRGGRGLLFSTYGIDPQTPAGDAMAAHTLLQRQIALAERHDLAAQIHQTIGFASVRGVDGPNKSALIPDQAPLQAMYTSLSATVSGESFEQALADAALRKESTADDQVPHCADPILTFSARGSLVQIAGQSQQHHVGETATTSSGHDTSVAVGEQLRIHTGEAISYLGGASGVKKAPDGSDGIGLSLISGDGELDVQAQQSDLQIHARKDLNLISQNGALKLAAGKSLVMKTAGGASLTMKDGGVTFACPGTMTVHSGKRSFNPTIATSYGVFDSPHAVIPPIPTGIPSHSHRLQSTFALDQLTTLANTTSAAEFVMMLVPIFGFDIPAHTYLSLRTALRNGEVPNPEIHITDAALYPADYDNNARVIRIRQSAVDPAVEDDKASQLLLTVLLHEFGHHIDNLLRTDFADKQPDGTSTLAPDGPMDEGAGYTYRIAFYDMGLSGQTVYAEYASPDYCGPLAVDYEQAHAFIKANQGEDAQRVDVKAGSREAFGAGRGAHHTAHSRHSYGHESIEDALKRAGFTPYQCKSIYFGNWLRDYSQLLDPKIVRAPGEPKNFPYKLSRKVLTQLVDLLALKEFHSLVGERETKRKDYYLVNEKMLGVYRPVEHIDNPKNTVPDPLDPQTVDPDFAPWVMPADPKLKVMRDHAMKAYIFDSKMYMYHQIEDAKLFGMTLEGMRSFGAGLHVLEDYFAHSNFVELSLRKLGYDKVLPWTAEVNCRFGWPVVTGMFGSFDVIASLAEPLAMMLFPVDDGEFVASSPQEYSDAVNMMRILVEDHENPSLSLALNQYLKLHNKWANTPGHEHVERAMWLAGSPLRLIINAHNLLLQTLLQQLGDSVDDGQTLWDDNPNASTSTDPSHSQLAKDHDTHPFHTLAAELASYAVEQVGQCMRDTWAENQGPQPHRLAAGFMCHPQDSTWQDEIVAAWAKKNPEKIRQGESATVLQHLHKEFVATTLERISEMGRHSTAGWDYIQKYYKSLFQKNNETAP